MKAVFEAHAVWNKRTSTRALTAGSPRQPNSIRRPRCRVAGSSCATPPRSRPGRRPSPCSEPAGKPARFLSALSRELVRDTSSSTACGASHHAQGQNPYAEDGVRQDRGRACFETRPVGAPQHEGDSFGHKDSIFPAERTRQGRVSKDQVVNAARPSARSAPPVLPRSAPSWRRRRGGPRTHR